MTFDEFARLMNESPQDLSYKRLNEFVSREFTMAPPDEIERRKQWSRDWAANVEQTEIGDSLSDMAANLHTTPLPPLFSDETIDLDAEKAYLQTLLTDVLTDHDAYLPGDEWPSIVRVRAYLEHGVY